MLTDLTETERLIVANAATGRPTDVAVLDDTAVRAEVLVSLLTDDAHPLRALSVSGAHITGTLDLEALTVLRPMVLTDCIFERAVELSEARAPKVVLQSCTAPAVYAHQLETRGDLDLSGITAAQIIVNGAKVGGTLWLTDAQLGPSDGTTLQGVGMDVTGELICRGLEVDGDVRLDVSRIGRIATFAGAHLQGRHKYALGAPGLQVGADLRFWDADHKRFDATGEVAIQGAHVGGVLVLAGARMSNPGGVAFNGDGMRVEGTMFCTTERAGERFDCLGEVRVVGARIGDVLLNGAKLTSGTTGVAFGGDGAVIDGSLTGHLANGHRLEVDGRFSLIGVSVATLDLDGASLRAEDGAALDLSVSKISGFANLAASGATRFEADGEITLDGTRIGSSVDLSGAHLRNDGGWALRAGTLEVGEWLHFKSLNGHRFEADGWIGLSGARIAGHVDFEGARISHLSGKSLVAERMQVLGGVRFRSDGAFTFEADGPLDITSAVVHSKLEFDGARCDEVQAHGLRVHGDLVGGVETKGSINLRNAVVDGMVDLRTATVGSFVFERGRCGRLVLPASSGEVDLRDAEVSEFYDDPENYRARVAGFSYKSLGEGCRSLSARLRWLEALDGYVPGAYDQLAAVYRRAGNEDDAKKVLIAKQVRRRKTRSRPGRIVGLVAAPIGYGYRTWRALAAFVVILGASWVIFDRAYPKHMVALKPKGQLPDFHGLVYALDAMLPVINLGQEAAWAPKGFAEDWYVFSVLSGWVLGLGLIAFLTAWFFRE